MWQSSHFLIICVFLFLYSVSEANNYGVYPRTRLGVRQNLYSGEKGKSFAETSVGYGAGVSVFLDGRHFIPFFGFNVGTMTGRQAFLDNSTEVTSSFTYYSAATEMGLQIFPIERRTKGFNVYFVGIGIVGYNEVGAVRKITSEFPNAIIDFGAGHSYFPDETHFRSVQEHLSAIENIFLLLPSEDKIESLKICNERLKDREGQEIDEHKINANRWFIEHPSNYRLAKHTIYTINQTPTETANQIIRLLK